MKNVWQRSRCMMGDRNNNYAANAASPVQDFYRDGCVLVTGGTGFVGKALLEKLLRSCPGISSIFVLIRPKRGLDPESRFRELLKNSVCRPYTQSANQASPTLYHTILLIRSKRRVDPEWNFYDLCCILSF